MDAHRGAHGELLDLHDAHRYEFRRAGDLVGWITYVDRAGVRELTHAEVVPAFRGLGAAASMTAAALADIRARGLHMVPRCGYVTAYVRRHPETADLLPRVDE